jgi:hypothetical protein
MRQATPRVQMRFCALGQHFAVGGVTSMLMWETNGSTTVDERFSALCDATIILGFDHGKEMRRTMRVQKCRGTMHELAAKEIEIGNAGIRVK